MAVADWQQYTLATYQAGIPLSADAPLLRDVAVDDATTGYGALGTDPVTAAYYFSAGQQCDQVRLTVIVRNLLQYTMEGSNDGSTWSTVVPTQVPAPFAVTTTQTFSHSFTAATWKYWRLSVDVHTGPPVAKQLTLTDFRLYDGATLHTVAIPPPPSARRPIRSAILN